MEEFDISVWDHPDFEDLIAEILYGEEFVCLISQESGFSSLDIEIHPKQDGQPWRFKLADLESAIERARKRLWELRRAEAPEDDVGSEDGAL